MWFPKHFPLRTPTDPISMTGSGEFGSVAEASLVGSNGCRTGHVLIGLCRFVCVSGGSVHIAFS